MLQGLNNTRMVAYNHRLFLFLLYMLKKSSLSDIADLSKLSLPTVARIADQLERKGVIEKTEPGKGRGHSAGIYSMRNCEQLIICIEIRPDSLRSVICNILGELKSDLRITDITLTTKEALLDLLDREILFYRKQDPSCEFKVALAIHGQVDHINGVSLIMPQAPWHESFHVAFLLHNKTGLEVKADNDCVMRALAQKWYLLRRDRKIRDFCTVNLDYGIGSSFLLNNEIVRGQLFGSGQIGHTIVDPHGRKCSCGRYGCLETVASLDAIMLSLKESGLPEDTDFTDIVRMYAEGDEKVRLTVNNAAGSIGRSLYNFLNVMNINHIYLYGRACLFGEEFLETVRKTVMSNPFDRQKQIKEYATGIEFGSLNETEQTAGISYLFSPVESISPGFIY